MKIFPRVSVIIPVKDYDRLLVKCIDSILCSRYPSLEILIVTRKMDENIGRLAKLNGVKVIKGNLGRSEARNLGLKLAQGAYILFLDSDQEITPNTIKNSTVTCFRENVNAVKVPEFFTGRTLWERSSAYWKNLMVEAWGVNGGIPRFYDKKVLSNGFEEKGIWWEDQELFDRLSLMGLKTRWGKGLIIHHENGNLRKFTEKYQKYGSSTSVIEDRYKLFKEKTLLTLKTLRLLFFRKPDSLELWIGTLLVTGIKSLAFLIGVIRNKIR
jgi:glycosyltransferase involved in cell wall biosynthesis